MILNERESRHEHVLHVARQMMTAARTAPKGKGVDIIEIAMVTDGNINILSEMMVKMVAEHGMKFFLRDAEKDRKSTRLNSSHSGQSRMPSSA